MTSERLTRRSMIRSGLAAGAVLGTPALLRAQDTPIRLAALAPLTGSGASYGPAMAKAAQSVINQVDAEGGILGRQIELTVIDDQTSPEAAVRAARQLIEVNKVAAIIGTWSSAVTTAVAPLCWESQTFLACTSGAESITQLPHQGYLIRTQPTTQLQGMKFGQFAAELGAKKVFILSPQTPFFQSQYDSITAAVKAAGGQTASLVYDDQKPSYRSEVDTMLRFAPDAVILGGYTPDTTVMLKDLFRAGYKGIKIGFGYAINQKLVESVPASVVNGCYTLSPSPAETSAAFATLIKLTGIAHPDPYAAQVFDQTNLIILAMAQAKAATGTAIRDTIRKVSQAPGGTVVENAPDGLKAIAAGEAIAYGGASGPCKFTDRGDITDTNFRYEQVQDGAIKLLKIV